MVRLKMPQGSSPRPRTEEDMERVAAMPDASLYVNRDGERADDCVDSMVEEGRGVTTG